MFFRTENITLFVVMLDNRKFFPYIDMVVEFVICVGFCVRVQTYVDIFLGLRGN